MLERLARILSRKGQTAHDGINLRGWFTFFVAFLVGLTAVVLLSLHAGDQGGWTGRLWLLALYLFYISLCCSFFPAPTAWIVLLMASPIFGLIEPAAVQRHFQVSGNAANHLAAAGTVGIVAAIGALGTAVANLNEYHVFTFLLRFGKVRKIRETRLYQSASRYFDVCPFRLMTAVSFLPIPIDVVRWLAITHQYRRDHFALASFLGRCLRYGLLAGAAFYLKIGWQGIVIVQAVIIIVLLGLRFITGLYKTRPVAANGT